MRLIDAKQLEKQVKEAFETQNPVLMGQMLRWIRKQKTIDAVPVVRCRECKHHRDKNEQEQQYLAEDILICTSQDATEDCWNAVWPDHFCSYGEKEGAD